METKKKESKSKSASDECLVYLGLLIATIALCLSILAFCDNGKCTTLDVVLSLIGICATFIVGASVIDAVRVHQIEKRLEEVSQSLIEIDYIKAGTNIGFNVAWGMAYLQWRPYSALRHFLKAYGYAIKMNDTIRAKACVSCIRLVYNTLKEKRESIDTTDKDKIKKALEGVRDEDLHKIVFKRDIDKILSDINMIE